MMRNSCLDVSMIYNRIGIKFEQDYLIELNYIRMSNNFKDMNLPCDSLNIRLIFYLVLLQNLDSDFFTCQDMRSQSDLAKRALTERPAFNKVIIIDLPTT